MGIKSQLNNLFTIERKRLASDDAPEWRPDSPDL